ncbi:MAG: 2-dehydropantoate 2-reductase N-terminal domain-containing protein [Pseudomonadota bacterium]
MSRKVLILGASYGSLLGTKLLMAGHDVTLVCRKATAELINAEGTEVRIKLRDEDLHRPFRSENLAGTLDAMEPGDVRPEAYDLIVLAMSEPQYAGADVRTLLSRIALAKVPCLSLMNMPPMPYLKRIPGLDAEKLAACFTSLDGWREFEPGLVSLCSPDPQAFRLPDTGANVLHVGLPTNFKAAPFAAAEHNEMLKQLEADIDAIRVDGKDVPVKLRAHDSLFVPFAKWAMLLTGNYRCVQTSGVRPIKEAVHNDIETSRLIYQSVTDLVIELGATPESQVPFEKYARAADGLLKPSSAARAIDGGAQQIERVDLLVQLIADQLGLGNPAVDEVVSTVTMRLSGNRQAAA